ncbi:TylF/MycF/NovP-related O-methyltransferase [Nostoc sp.]|uniref:TylF/MycF/NovP-related O-methyltransferase n=1 Tax=Nostoc sp. TaxID=1180 RepID=UPI002FF53E0C
MDKITMQKLADEHPMVSVERLENIYHNLSHTLLSNISGAVVEIGCNAGGTSVFLKMIINELAPDRELHVYDSFRGLPQKSFYDTLFDEGDLAASLYEVKNNFCKWGLDLPVIHRGWFQDTLPTELPNCIAFAYLDSDFYDSILISLQHVYSRLSNNAFVLIDDYWDSDQITQDSLGLPGVKKACDVFFIDKLEKINLLPGSGNLAMGYFRKR